MSKEKALKRSLPISAWLKKENLSTKEENSADENQSKSIKHNPIVYLEPIDVGTTKVVDKQIFAATSFKQKLKVENQTTGLRRSARNLPSSEKVEKQLVNKDPVLDDLPPIVFKGKINYVSEFYDCASVCDKLLTDIENSKESVIPIGFDLEWPFSFQTGSGKTALAQICLSENVCHLLHLYHLKKLPTSFIALLSHSKVKLVGINIKNDVWKLTRDFKEFPGQKVVENNCLDCGPHANIILNRSCRWSLERLTAYLLKKRIDKDPSVRRSKWHVHPLNAAQKLYAATDAYVSLLLHLTIEQQKTIQIKEEKCLQES